MQRKLTILMLALLPIASAWADGVKIGNDSSDLPPELVQNLAQTSKSMGVKEPMNISTRSEGGARYATRPPSWACPAVKPNWQRLENSPNIGLFLLPDT